MAKYNTFKYGAEKYGSLSYDADLLWTFIVAWDGYYSWGNETEQMVDLSVERGRLRMVDKQGSVQFPPGQAVAVFDNEDGRYDAFNTSSPLYPNVTPGKFVRIAVKDNDSDTNQEIMRGIIEDIQPIYRSGGQYVRIVVIDGLKWLQDHSINKGLSTSVAKDAILAHILSFADWPTVEWGTPDVTQDSDTLDYWWAWNQIAYDAVKEFNQAEQAVGFCARDGAFTWRPWNYAYDAMIDLTQSEILKDIGRPQPWEVVKNKIRISSAPKVLDAVNTTLWELQSIPFLPNGGTFYIEPIFKYEEWQPCGSSITFNHTVTERADGTGLNLTANCELTYNPQIGEGAEITIVNTSGQNGYITLLRAVGDAIYASDIDIREAEDATSQNLYGIQTLELDSRWVVDSDDAGNLADTLLAAFKDPIMHPIIQIEDRFAEQFSVDLHDMVALNVSNLGINDTYRIGHIRHKWLNENGTAVRTTYRLEPFLSGDAYFGCMIYLTNNQSIDDSTNTPIEFESETFDVGFYHDTGTNPDRVTIPAGMGGYYHITAQVYWDNADTDGVRIAYIMVDGSEIAQAYDDAQTTDFIQHLSVTANLSAGSYIQVVVYQDSGSTLDVQWGRDFTRLSVDRVPDQ